MSVVHSSDKAYIYVPIVIFLRNLSLVSMTLCQVIVSGSMSSKENFRFSSSVKLSGSVEEIPNWKTKTISYQYQILVLSPFPDAFSGCR